MLNPASAVGGPRVTSCDIVPVEEMDKSALEYDPDSCQLLTASAVLFGHVPPKTYTLSSKWIAPLNILIPPFADEFCTPLALTCTCIHCAFTSSGCIVHNCDALAPFSQSPAMRYILFLASIEAISAVVGSGANGKELATTVALFPFADIVEVKLILSSWKEVPSWLGKRR